MPLFDNAKELLIAVGALFIVFCISVGVKYADFTDFISIKYRPICGEVIQNYIKQKSPDKPPYRVLKIKADGFLFYTTTRRKNLSFNAVCLDANTSNLSFLDYLKGTFYLPSRQMTDAASTSPSLSKRLSNIIKSQHENPKIAELFSALYLATPYSKELRANVTNWGIAHIIAISGFHLSLLLAITFLILRYSITPIISRFWPFFNLPFYATGAIFLAMGFYLWLLDFTPSFLRSYLMGVLGFLLLARGLAIFRFGTLLFCILLAIAISPSLLFSIGFYFSAMGVFFIFLYINHFGRSSDLKSPIKIAIHTLFLEIFVFCSMNIPVYFFFPAASFYQLSVIPLAYVFVIFYPISIVLHLAGFGGVMDGYLLSFLEFAPRQAEIFVPFWGFILFNIAALLAIRFKSVATLLALSGIGVYLGGLLF